MNRTPKELTAITMGIAVLSIVGYSISQANPTPIERNKALSQGTLGTAVQMIEEGRETFRFDTFGDEAFWGDGLRLHEAIKGEGFGGVGPGLSPAAALQLGLKVDLEALPPGVRLALKRGQVDLEDPATTLALLKLDAVLAVKGFFGEEGASCNP